MPDNSSSWTVEYPNHTRTRISKEELEMAYYKALGIKPPPNVIKAFENRLILNEIENIWEEVPE